MKRAFLFFLAASFLFLVNPALGIPAEGSSLHDKTLTVFLDEPAALYNEPGNQYFEPLTDLPVGTQLRPLGIFGDYVKVELGFNGRHMIGYVRKESIHELPQSLPILSQTQVPWQEMFIPSCAPGDFDASSNTLVLATLPGENFRSFESAAWTLEKPVRIKLEKYSVQGDHASSIKVLGSPEGGVDPTIWWKGVTAMGIEIQRGSVYLSIMDGVTENGKSFFDLKLDPSQPMQIVFDQPEGKSFAVLDKDGRQVNHIDLTNLAGAKLPNGLFPQRKFYFGFNLVGQSSISLTGLSIAAQPDEKWKNPSDSGEGLITLAKNKQLKIGNTFELQYMIDRRYCQIMDHDFNLVTVPEFSTDGVPFWTGPGQYNYYYIDRIVDFAARRGWQVLASHLVYGDKNDMPDWLEKSAHSRNEYIEILKQHIQTVIAHYKGRVNYWSIANEMVTRQYWKQMKWPTSTFHDFWYEKIGPEYVEMAFQWAKEADPSAKLFFNDAMNTPPFNKDSTTINAMMLAMVKELKAKNVPIDAVGMQLHTEGPQSNDENSRIITTREYLQSMQEYAKLGVRIYITEMDVNLGNVAGSQAERYNTQAVVFRNVVDACLESKVCDVFNVWGISDGQSYIVSPFFGKEPDGDPLLFDRDFNPKPAYFGVKDALAGIAPTATPTGSLVSTQTPQPSVIPSAPAPASSIIASMIDDFEAPARNGSFDKAKWSLTGTSTKKQAIQQGGLIRLVNAADEGDVTLTSLKFSSLKLTEPIFIEAALLLPTETAAGKLGFSLTGSSSALGTWWGGCAIERFSSQYLAYCSDFVYPPRDGHTYETARQTVQPNSWHVFRLELDPATMTLRYLVDGVEVGKHGSVDADALRMMKFKLILNTWKTKYEGSLIGYVAYIASGKMS